jgi:RND family efflux transporter MFP subunit
MAQIAPYWILAGAGVLACACWLAVAQEPDASGSHTKTEASALVTTATLHQGSIASIVTGYGVVGAVPGQTRNLTLPQAGLVTDVRITAGEAVERGQQLLTLINDPAGRAAFQQAQTSIAFTRSELERTRQLRAQNLATESQVAAADKAFRDATAVLDAQRELGVSAARSELTAPFDGIVLDVPVAPGDRTAAGAVLVRIIAEGSVQVAAGLTPQDARRVAVGMPAVIELVADNHPMPALVTHVHAMINPTSRLVDVVLEPVADAHSTGLLTAEGARAVITVAQNTYWLAPRAAVLRDGDGTHLFQIVKGRAKRVDVTTPGAETDQEIAVEGSVDPAAKVAVLGAYELEDGMAVHESAAEAAPETQAP